MGKTLMQLEWAKHVPGRVLVLAPLAVAQQTVSEGAKFGIEVKYARSQYGSDADGQITITNYEMLDHFDPASFDGVVLDESSILKSFDGKTRTRIIESFAHTPYKLACTATPAPNDYMELGNHAEFLNVMSRTEMLSMFFVHDGGETSKWRLKGHAEQSFWAWIASWCCVIRKPSDLGYDDDGFSLPPLAMHETIVKCDKPDYGQLFVVDAATLQERIAARRSSTDERVQAAAKLVNSSTECWIVWCGLNAESELLTAAINGAVQIKGSDKLESKRDALEGFANGSIRVLVTKPKIAGFGLNWQHCHNECFVGLSDSWEQYYQALRRCWRFGQEKTVNVHLVVAETEGNVLKNIKRKDADASAMAESIVTHMRAQMESNIRSGGIQTMDKYSTDKCASDRWTMHLGDCVDTVKAMPDASIDYSVFSPPFESLYTYSASTRDMGNSKNSDEFAVHFGFLVDELFRVLKSGRLVSFHCMNLPTSKVRDGVIGIRDFRGQMIQLFVDRGFIFHSEVCIWKDPVTAMQRTKALGLLYKQLKKDSAMSRQGIPDYLVTMRKPGVNPEPVTKTEDGFPVGVWQNYASPVWMDINPSNTLQYRSAREDKDERHICPLQLEVIERAINLWTNPDDLVLSPFAGIGSEGYMAVQLGRRFVGVELKQSYYDQACRNLADAKISMGGLFDDLPAVSSTSKG